jgi:hypothetical protein
MESLATKAISDVKLAYRHALSLRPDFWKRTSTSASSCTIWEDWKTQ